MYVRLKPRTKYAGIYAIRHKLSGRMYVGRSNDITGRWTHHRFMLRRGLHKTKALQDLWVEDEFEFIVLETCAISELQAREQAWLDKTPNALNTFLDAAGRGTHGPSERGKAAAKARWSRPDYRQKRESFLTNRVQGRFQIGAVKCH
jgi:group I intron endonuclease